MQHSAYPINGTIGVEDYPCPVLAAWQALGYYDYVLVDPRPVLPDGCLPIFYVGKGLEYRVMQHVWAALALEDSGVLEHIEAALGVPPTNEDEDGEGEGEGEADRERLGVLRDPTPDFTGEDERENDAALEPEKLARIREIHAAGYPVQMFILDYQPFGEPPRTAQEHAYVTERVIMDVIKLNVTGRPASTLREAGLTNIVHGHGHATGRGATDLFALLAELAPIAAPPLPSGASILVRGGNCRNDSYADIVQGVSGDWHIGAKWRTRELAIFVLADGVIRAVRRPLPESWRAVHSDPAYEFWQYDSEPIPELERKYKGTSLSALDLGRPSWPQHTWVPDVHSHLNNLPAGAPQRGQAPITLEAVWAARKQREGLIAAGGQGEVQRADR